MNREVVLNAECIWSRKRKSNKNKNRLKLGDFCYTKIMKRIFLIPAIIVAISALLIVFYSKRSSGPSMPTEAEFPNKVVYGTSQDLDAGALKKDCDARGGEFNTCGSVCGPEAEACIQVCAFTCELK